TARGRHAEVMIEIHELTKRYGTTTALDDVSCAVLPGRVTGLLGPNGAGKSTLLRVILGLDHPTHGTALIDGMPYARLPRPSTVVGAHLGGTPWHPRRSARQHLVALARASGICSGRVDEVLALAGLTAVCRRDAGGFSLGMGQRLGLAAALLGDPKVILLDEPVNGLDTDGVRWIRSMLRTLAQEGKAVLVSSHLMTEMQLVADHVIVLGRGRLLADVSTADLAGRARDEVLLLTTTCGEAVHHQLAAEFPGSTIDVADGLTTVRVTGIEEAEVGRSAHRLGLPVLHLSRRTPDLEAGYLDLVAGEIEYLAREETHRVA
ncbi:MAG: ybhF 1, partial [Mycobacterium sp.]|nr:ybhF 1 [Mycobacterium sp.]